MDRSTGSFFSTSVTGVGEGDRLRTISSPHRIARRTTSPSTLALDVSTRIACFHDDGNSRCEPLEKPSSFVHKTTANFMDPNCIEMNIRPGTRSYGSVGMDDAETSIGRSLISVCGSCSARSLTVIMSSVGRLNGSGIEAPATIGSRGNIRCPHSGNAENVSASC